MADATMKSKNEPFQELDMLFVVLKRTTMFTLSALIDGMRLTNDLRNSPLFRYRIVTVDGNDTVASNGFPIPSSGTLPKHPYPRHIIIVASWEPEPNDMRVLVKFLQQAAERGCVLYGIDQGAIVLAESGVLDGHAATTHWETVPAAQHRFPNVVFEEKNLVVDRNRVTSPGHTACLDLLVNLIAKHASKDLSIAFANELIHSRLRPEGDQQRLTYFSPKIGRNSYIDFALAIMRDTIEQPRKISEIAREVGVSPRQLELRFQREFGLTPSHYYNRLRLSAARQYLVYSNMAVLNIAFSCGFSSHGAFSRSFRSEFKMTPTEYRSRFNSKTDRSYVE